jgi:hypothetical protein
LLLEFAAGRELHQDRTGRSASSWRCSARAKVCAGRGRICQQRAIRVIEGALS